MDTCACGVTLKRFWLWRDAHGVLHASAFRPSTIVVRSVLAVNARDAILPFERGRPKHVVLDVDDPSMTWPGRCSDLARSA